MDKLIQALDNPFTFILFTILAIIPVLALVSYGMQRAGLPSVIGTVS